MTIEQASGLETALRVEAELAGSLCLSLDRNTAAMRDRQAWLDRLADAIWQVPMDPIPLGALPVVRVNAGPTTGYYHAIQRVTVGPIGATTDLIHVYKSRVSVEQQPQTALTTLTGASSAAGAFLTWTPGRTGCVLHPDERIGLSGTITGTNPVMNWEVVQVEAWAFPLYLI